MASLAPLELARYAAAGSEIYEDHFNKYKAACEKYDIVDAVVDEGGLAVVVGLVAPSRVVARVIPW